MGSAPFFSNWLTVGLESFAMDRGFIKVWRKAQDHPDYPLNQKREFTEFEAWIDLILLAAGKDKMIGKAYYLRGQVPMKYPELASRWRWSLSKVKRYFLKKKSKNEIEIVSEPQIEPQIEPQKSTSANRISIVNYELYNPMRTDKNSESEPQIEPQIEPPLYKGSTKEVTKENIYSRIFDFWNDQKIVIHRKYPPPPNGKSTIKTAVNNLVKGGYSENEIRDAITVYSRILKSDRHFFNYRWSLVEFLIRGFEKFRTWELANSNYRENNGKNADQRGPSQKQIHGMNITTNYDNRLFQTTDGRWWESDRKGGYIQTEAP